MLQKMINKTYFNNKNMIILINETSETTEKYLDDLYDQIRDIKNETKDMI